jgi:hypothetical protein
MGFGVAAERNCRILDVQEAAAELKLSIARVRLLCYSGRIPARKIGKGWAMLLTDVSDFGGKPRPVGRPRS